MTGKNQTQLITAPTPLEPAPRLAAALGLAPGSLHFKRDDLLGLGGGGNKARKLQYTCAAAREEGATLLVATGGPQSNHARLTAAAGARLGLRVLLVLKGEAPPAAEGNLLLDALFGATVLWAGDVSVEALQRTAAAAAERCEARGERAYLIPFGGSSALAAQGYVDAGRELLAQLPGVDHVVVTLGSGGTMAGLVRALGTARVLGVDCGALPDPRAVVLAMLRELGAQDAVALRVDGGQVGPGYSHLTEAVREAMQLTARTEGVVLDPVYTGRAMAGLIAAVRAGSIRPTDQTVFVHTGGLPGLFGHGEAVAWLRTLAGTTGPARP